MMVQTSCNGFLQAFYHDSMVNDFAHLIGWFRRTLALEDLEWVEPSVTISIKSLNVRTPIGSRRAAKEKAI